MTKSIVAGAVLLTAIFVLCPSHRTTAQSQEKPASGEAEFANKFLAVNYMQAGQYSSGLLKNVRVVRLGGREFLVGEYAVEDGASNQDWKDVAIWLPMESIDNFMVIGDYQKARRILATAHKVPSEK